nr:NADPH-dependent FMN reductase [Pseudomonas sp. RGM2987]
MRTIHLLGLCASLRRESNNAIILSTISTELLPPNVLLHIHPLHDLPLYNGDQDGDDAPVPVVALREAVNHAEGVILASPEYSHGMSGVMKNALDWLSSPHRRSPLKDKPTLMLTGSTAFIGGARAQQQLSETLWAIQAALVPYPPIVISDIHTKISDHRLTHSATREFLARGIVTMEQSIRMEASKPELIWA